MNHDGIVNMLGIECLHRPIVSGRERVRVTPGASRFFGISPAWIRRFNVLDSEPKPYPNPRTSETIIG